MALLSFTAAHTPTMMRALTTFRVHRLFAGAVAVTCGMLLLHLFPRLETELFVGGAARLASLLSGVAAVRMDEGWALSFSGQLMIVTAACSATDFSLMTAALLGWHFSRWARSTWLLPAAAAGALVVSVPLTLSINALRLIAVAQMHCWVIPLLPSVYGHFLHMITGVAVFLPALIALNLLLEIYGRPRVTFRD